MIPKLKIRRGRIRRTGLVLTPVVMLLIGYIVYSKSEFREFPFGCYETDKRSSIGFSSIDVEYPSSCIAIKNVRAARLDAPKVFEYKGATLYNSEGVGEVEFGQMTNLLKKIQSEVVWEYYFELLETLSYIIGASLLGLGALWMCLAALDWVLAA